MAIPFARTLRALEADHSRLTLAALIAAIALIGVWAGWFFAARMPVYQMSATADLSAGNEVTAYFSPETANLAQRGQPAFIRLAGNPADIPAIVLEVGGGPDGTTRVDLSPRASFPLELQPGNIVQVEIQVERVSPAVLVLRAAGRFLETTPITLR